MKLSRTGRIAVMILALMIVVGMAPPPVPSFAAQENEHYRLFDHEPPGPDIYGGTFYGGLYHIGSKTLYTGQTDRGTLIQEDPGAAGIHRDIEIAGHDVYGDGFRFLPAGGGYYWIQCSDGTYLKRSSRGFADPETYRYYLDRVTDTGDATMWYIHFNGTTSAPDCKIREKGTLRALMIGDTGYGKSGMMVCESSQLVPGSNFFLYEKGTDVNRDRTLSYYIEGYDEEEVYLRHNAVRVYMPCHLKNYTARFCVEPHDRNTRVIDDTGKAWGYGEKAKIRFYVPQVMYPVTVSYTLQHRNGSEERRDIEFIRKDHIYSNASRREYVADCYEGDCTKGVSYECRACCEGEGECGCKEYVPIDQGWTSFSRHQYGKWRPDVGSHTHTRYCESRLTLDGHTYELNCNGKETQPCVFDKEVNGKTVCSVCGREKGDLYILFNATFHSNKGDGKPKTYTESICPDRPRLLPDCKFRAPDRDRSLTAWAVGSPDGEWVYPDEEYWISEDTDFYAIWRENAQKPKPEINDSELKTSYCVGDQVSDPIYVDPHIALWRGKVTYIWYVSPNPDGSDARRIEAGRSASVIPLTAKEGTFFYFCDVINTIEDNGDGGIKSATGRSDIVPVRITRPDKLYDLKVTGGSGSGSYKAGKSVELTPDAPPEGYEFDHWDLIKGKGSFGHYQSFYRMGAEDSEIKAVYKAVPHSVKVTGGTGSGTYTVGDTVNIKAGEAPPGKEFVKWEIISGEPKIKDEGSGDTSFAMRGHDIEIKAVFDYIPGTVTVINGSGGGKFRQGQTVYIASAMQMSTVFDRWEVVSGNPVLKDIHGEFTSFVMPAGDVTVKAVRKDVLYEVRITGGTGSGWYKRGDIVDIKAADVPGKVFDHWDSDMFIFNIGDANAAETTVRVNTMPVYLTAVYRDAPHLHTGTEVKGKDPTCTEDGWKSYYSCTCGKYFEDEACTREIEDIEAWKKADGKLDRKPHATGEWKHDEAQHWKVCAVCGQDTDRGDHSFGEWKTVTAAGEHTEGLKTRACTVCGYSEDAVIPPTGHVHIGGKVKGKVPSCTEDGWKDHYVCRCGDCFADEACTVEIEDLEAWKKGDGKLEKTGHAAGGWQKDRGSHWKECTVCGVISDRGDHKWGDPVILKEASDTEDGLEKVKCTVCGYEEERVIPGRLHRHQLTRIPGQAPTCTEDGWKDYYGCACGELYGSEDGIRIIGSLDSWKKTSGRIAAIPHEAGPWKHDAAGHWKECTMCGTVMEAAGHSYGEWTVKKAASGKVDGLESRTCMVCGHEETRLIPATGHDHEAVLVEGKDPTCTENGWKSYYTCVCGKAFEDEGCTVEIDNLDKWKKGDGKIDMVPHSYGEWEVVREATETVQGKEKRTCSVCGKEEIRITPLKPHVHKAVPVEGKDPTCTDDGWKSYYTCSCGKAFEDEGCLVEIDNLDKWKKGDGKIDMVPHSYGEWEVVREATETVQGKEKRTCSVCGKEEIRITPLKPHVHKAVPVEGKDPTCTDDGWKSYYTCSCGKAFEDEGCTVEIDNLDKWKKGDGKIDMVPHSYGEWEVVREATETVQGKEKRTCSVCGKEEIRITPLKPHVHKAVPVEGKDPTCTDDGWKDYYTCGCGKFFEDEGCLVEIDDLDKWKKEAGCLEKKGHSPGEWKSDEEGHWRVCSECGAVIDRAPHEYGDGSSCTVCGHSDGTAVPEDRKDGGGGPKTGDESSLGLLAAAAVLSVIGGMYIVGRRDDE